MKNSNLAECFEEFAAIVRVLDSPAPNSPRILAVVTNTERPSRPRPVPARRRIQIRDQGLGQFRVF